MLKKSPYDKYYFKKNKQLSLENSFSDYMLII